MKLKKGDVYIARLYNLGLIHGDLREAGVLFKIEGRSKGEIESWIKCFRDFCDVEYVIG